MGSHPLKTGNGRGVPAVGESREGVLGAVGVYNDPAAGFRTETAWVVPHSTIHQRIGIDRRTANSYLDALATLGIIDELPPWAGNHRKRLVIERVKRQFTDAGLAAAVAGLTTDDVYRSSEFRGRILHSFIASQLRVEAEASDRVSLYHLRTENGDHEIDLLAERGPHLFAFEYRAGSSPRRADARNLIWFRDQVPVSEGDDAPAWAPAGWAVSWQSARLRSPR